MIAKVLANKS
jgi:Cdc6-like AAA superfamily ATPase